MTIKERVAYLEGLAEGMKVDSTGEGKLIIGIIETLKCISDEIDEINENALDIGEELDALSDDLAEVEDYLEDLELDVDEAFDFDEDWSDFGDDDYDDDDYDDDSDFEDDDDSDFEDDDDDDDGEFTCCDMCGAKGFTIDVNCPECGAQLELDEKDIAKESVYCTACGKLIELQIDEVDVDDGDDDEGDAVTSAYAAGMAAGEAHPANPAGVPPSETHPFNPAGNQGNIGGAGGYVQNNN